VSARSGADAVDLLWDEAMSWLGLIREGFAGREASLDEVLRVAAARGRRVDPEARASLEALRGLGWLVTSGTGDGVRLAPPLLSFDPEVLQEVESQAVRFLPRHRPLSSSEQPALWKVVELVLSLRPTTAVLRELCEKFHQEAQRGVEETGSSLKMLKTFARQPSGREGGRVVVVDWGGTNCRAVAVSLDGRGGYRLENETSFKFEDRLKKGPAADVFDAIAATIEQLLEADGTGEYSLALIYSFPARLHALDHAVSLKLTKGWRPRGLEGENIVALLRAALDRRRLSRVKVRAVANDTVAPMVLCSYERRAKDSSATLADMGLILGTGTNQAIDLGDPGIRNMESGGFDGVRRIQGSIDRALDAELSDPSPGGQLYEKMVSGQYLGEVVRRALLELARSTPWFRRGAPALTNVFGLDSAVLSAIAVDDEEERPLVAAELGKLEVDSDVMERSLLQWLAHAVVRRSARLVAVGILGALRCIDPAGERPHCVAVDGSLYGGYPRYDELLRSALDEVGGASTSTRVTRVFVKNSTSAGAAVIAAAAADRQSAGHV